MKNDKLIQEICSKNKIFRKSDFPIILEKIYYMLADNFPKLEDICEEISDKIKITKITHNLMRIEVEK